MNKFRLAKAGINVNDGITRFGGDTALYENLLLDFLNDTHLRDLESALEAGDIQAAFQAAHALKGIAGTLSLDRLYQQICPILETLRSGSQDIGYGMDDLADAAQKAADAIRELHDIS